HGIGLDKKEWLHLVRSDAEIAAMRRLKAAFDPNNILNAGRVFDLAPAASIRDVPPQ
ncbi:FAD-linked oxidase C-terminal domain-containing protein, partial [Mesorhizobium sp.]